MDDVEALGVMVVCNNVGGARSEGSPVLGVPVVSDGFVDAPSRDETVLVVGLGLVPLVVGTPVVSDGFVDAPSRDETVLVVGLVCVAGIILDNAAVAGSKSRADAAMLLAASAAAAATAAVVLSSDDLAVLRSSSESEERCVVLPLSVLGVGVDATTSNECNAAEWCRWSACI